MFHQSEFIFYLCIWVHKHINYGKEILSEDKGHKGTC